MNFTGDNQILTLVVREPAGIARECEPITWGIPFPEGVVDDVASIRMVHGGITIPSAITPLSRWKDGSMKWGLFDFQVSLDAHSEKKFGVCLGASGSGCDTPDLSPITMYEVEGSVILETGDTLFHIDTRTLYPLRQVIHHGRPMLDETRTAVRLVAQDGTMYSLTIERWRVHQQNPLRVELALDGEFLSSKDVHALRYECRIHVYSGKPAVRIDITVHNPRVALHPGCIWDLGDPGSIFFRELALSFGVDTKGDGPLATFQWEEEGCISDDTSPSAGKSPTMHRMPPQLLTENFELSREKDRRLSLYQNSSGGENWKSRNHMNRNEQIPLRFRGFEISDSDRIVFRGLRANPALLFSDSAGQIGISVKHFWQNFPKALVFEDGTLSAQLFPETSEDLFELQGGEKKKHTVYLEFDNESFSGLRLAGQRKPLQIEIPSEWYMATTACANTVPLGHVVSDESSILYQKLVDAAIVGENSFFSKREIIDEYGWRHFGDVYADHEAVFHKGDEDFISHYNNQYDIIKGAFIQFFRTGNHDWFELAENIADHVSDIDIYHTDKDRYQFNKGMFWHTDHHLDAATCTHRAISRKHKEIKYPQPVGGGPSYSHNYTTGLLYMYWLTGEDRYKESVLSLAENVLKGVQGPCTVSEVIFNTAKAAVNIAKSTFGKANDQSCKIYEFNGPGRASGNALNSLIDAYSLTSERRYIDHAQLLICRSVSPADRIAERDLLNVEIRWMYTVFLQSLGKYLDLKKELAEFDVFFQYSQETLLKYAEWMLHNEYPYLEKPEALEFPNETWAAQDIRKADILAHAASYAPTPLQDRLMKKARFFFNSSIQRVNEFETKSLTRPIAVLMSSGMSYMHVSTHRNSDNHQRLDFSAASARRLQRSHKWQRVSSFVRGFSIIEECRWILGRLKQL